MPIELAAEETRAWLTLLRAPGLGGAGIRDLLEHGGSAAGALAQARRSAPESARMAPYHKPVTVYGPQWGCVECRA